MVVRVVINKERGEACDARTHLYLDYGYLSLICDKIA